jgi:hypothetical protein
MKITMQSKLSGKTNTMDLDITNEQLVRYNMGIELVQTIFPNMSVDHREFLISGIIPEEWKDVFSNEQKEQQEYEEFVRKEHHFFDQTES